MAIRCCFFIGLLAVFSCKNAPKLPLKPAVVAQVVEDSFRYKIGPFWSQNCGNPDFKVLFNCNTEPQEYYEVDLWNELYKPSITISLIFKNGFINEVYLTRMHFTTRNLRRLKGFNKRTQIIIPSNGSAIYCFYKKPQKIRTNNEFIQLSVFFSDQIWKMPRKDEGAELDPEVWTIIARKDGRIAHWSRELFRDSIYYSNLQRLLDLCKVEEYRYKGRK